MWEKVISYSQTIYRYISCTYMYYIIYTYSLIDSNKMWMALAMCGGLVL